MVKCSKAEVRRLRTALRWKLPSTQRERIQMVLLREGGMTQPAIAAAMGVSLSTVNRAHQGTQAQGERRTQAREHDRGRGKGLAGALRPCCGGRRVVEHPRSQGSLRKGDRAPNQ